MRKVHSRHFKAGQSSEENSHLPIRPKNGIRVCSLHWGFMPGGGASYARYVLDIANYEPVSISSICVYAQNWPLDKPNLEVLRASLIRIRGRFDPTWVWKVRRLLKLESPDLILTNGTNSCFVAAVAGIGLNIPIVVSYHSEYLPTTLTQKMRKPFVNLLLKALFRHVVKEIVAVSNFSKLTLEGHGIDPSKITAIHNGIPLLPHINHRRDKIRSQLDVPHNTLLVGTACRLAVEKGLEWLLVAAVSVTHQLPHARFVIWGDGPQREYLNQLTRQLKLSECVAFPGYARNIADCFSAIDIFVMSSSTENFSITLLEAMRAGLPIIATNVGGNPEAIEHNKHGILVPVGTPKALADEILKLARNPDLRKALGDAALKRFEKEFTSERMVRETAQWLLDCTKKYKAR